jgi:hypothetical protein
MSLDRAIGWRRLVLPAAAALGLASAAGAASGPFAAAAAPPSASSGLPQVADLNGDHIADLVVVNSRGNSVSIFFGAPTGLGTAPDATLVGTGAEPLRAPRSVALGDFDGNGTTDIAVANAGGASVSVFLGNGDGTFQDAKTAVAPSHPTAIAVGRFRGAGQPLDLAVVGRLRDQLMLLLGNGDGTFTAAGPFAFGSRAQGLVVGDFGSPPKDGVPDGNLDVAVTTITGDALVFGDGDGHLGSPRTYSTRPKPAAIAVGDYNADGCPDLATATARAPDGAEVLLQDGYCGTLDNFSGAYIPFVLGHGSRPSAIAAAQLGGDARADVVVADAPRNRVVLLVSVSLGPGIVVDSFAPPVFCDVGRSPQGIAVGDFDGDGFDDLAVTNRKSDTVSILSGNGIGTACPTVTEIVP